jgi:hypothetical protein
MQDDSLRSRLMIVFYVRRDDRITGPARAARPGDNAWWVDTPALQWPHADVYRDKRILADIARRLRGEPAHAADPPAPLPGP